MKRSLLNLLRSPHDRSLLELKVTGDEEHEVLEGELIDRSGNRFPIAGGVPLFAEDAAHDPTFGFKWKLIGGSYGHDEPTRSMRRQWYLERFGFESTDALLDSLQSVRLILDAGAGSGVDTAMFAESGTAVVAVDLSRDATLALYRRLGDFPNVHVVQGDVMNLPFPDGAFDYISSDQVLHHTPDTGRSFAALCRLLSPDGRIAVYVYNRKGPIRELVDDFLRERTTRMSVEECYAFSRSVTLLGKALSELNSEVVVPEALSLLGIQAGAEDIQRFFYWNVMKCFWNDAYDFETNVVVNFDWYHPKYAHRHTPDDVARWLADQGLEAERLEEVRSGIAAIGRLPA